jgi:hypothetical protein
VQHDTLKRPKASGSALPMPPVSSEPQAHHVGPSPVPTLPSFTPTFKSIRKAPEHSVPVVHTDASPSKIPRHSPGTAAAASQPFLPRHTPLTARRNLLIDRNLPVVPSPPLAPEPSPLLAEPSKRNTVCSSHVSSTADDGEFRIHTATESIARFASASACDGPSQARMAQDAAPANSAISPSKIGHLSGVFMSRATPLATRTQLNIGSALPTVSAQTAVTPPEAHSGIVPVDPRAKAIVPTARFRRTVLVALLEWVLVLTCAIWGFAAAFWAGAHWVWSSPGRRRAAVMCLAACIACILFTCVPFPLPVRCA